MRGGAGMAGRHQVRKHAGGAAPPTPLWPGAWQLEKSDAQPLARHTALQLWRPCAAASFPHYMAVRTSSGTSLTLILATVRQRTDLLRRPAAATPAAAATAAIPAAAPAAAAPAAIQAEWRCCCDCLAQPQSLQVHRTGRCWLAGGTWGGPRLPTAAAGRRILWLQGVLQYDAFGRSPPWEDAPAAGLEGYLARPGGRLQPCGWQRRLPHHTRPH